MTLTVAQSDDILPVVAPADSVPGPAQGQWTYADYAAIPDDGRRYEIVDGVLYMAPTPLIRHQEADGLFVIYLGMHVKLMGLGRVFPAPTDVELAPGDVVQPDVLVVLKAHENRIQDGKIVGAPDLVVEIASPSTATYDRTEKKRSYERAGVPEYWIADAAARTIEVLVLENGVYTSLGVFQGKAFLPSRVVPILPVQADNFFG